VIPAEYQDSPTLLRHDDGRLQVLHAPAKASFVRELVELVPAAGLVGSTITIAEQVTYRIVGEDSALGVVWGDQLDTRVFDPARHHPVLPPLAHAEVVDIYGVPRFVELPAPKTPATKARRRRWWRR